MNKSYNYIIKQHIIKFQDIVRSSCGVKVDNSTWWYFSNNISTTVGHNLNVSIGPDVSIMSHTRSHIIETLKIMNCRE